jgi:hypothetical protein
MTISIIGGADNGGVVNAGYISCFWPTSPAPVNGQLVVVLVSCESPPDLPDAGNWTLIGSTEPSSFRVYAYAKIWSGDEGVQWLQYCPGSTNYTVSILVFNSDAAAFQGTSNLTGFNYQYSTGTSANGVDAGNVGTGEIGISYCSGRRLDTSNSLVGSGWTILTDVAATASPPTLVTLGAYKNTTGATAGVPTFNMGSTSSELINLAFRVIPSSTSVNTQMFFGTNC